MRALVSDDGRRVVTFDDWHMTGYGPHAVVIYDGLGRRVRALALQDFLSPGDLDALPRSTGPRVPSTGAGTTGSTATAWS